MRWPEPELVLSQMCAWAAQVATEHPGLERVGLAPGGAAVQRLSHGRSAATGQPLVVAQVAIRRLAAKSRWRLVMEPHQGDSAGRGWDDAREHGAL
jgi:hypothetical protein